MKRVRYRIADVNVDMDPVGDMPKRMKAYEADWDIPDITIEENELRLSKWKSAEDPNLPFYMETGRVFCNKILQYDGMMLHASAVMIEDRVYLFSGQCGIGKSTHAKLYLDSFGEKAMIINDDKPILRKIQGTWYAYGTPWCGKDGINRNAKGLLAGICFLQRGDTRITRLTPRESVPRILMHTQYYQTDKERMKKMLSLVDQLAKEVPAFEYYNHAQAKDAAVTYSAMNQVSEVEQI
jgi:hypothetical protein